MNRISRHISVKDLRKTRQRQIGEQKECTAKKLKEWQEAEIERKQIEEAAKPYKSNWRKELQESEWFPIPGSGPTNSASQSFEYGGEGGPRFTANGLGGQDVYPQNIDFFGDQIPTPSYSNLALQGYAPFLQMQKRGNQTEDERIDAEIRKLQEQIKQLDQKISNLSLEQKEFEPEYTGMTYDQYSDRKKEISKKWTEKERPHTQILNRGGSVSEINAARDKYSEYHNARGKELAALDADYHSQSDSHTKKVEDHNNAYIKKFDSLRKEQNALYAKIGELEKQRPINQQLDASQEAYPNLPFMGARVQSAAGQPSFNYDPAKTPFGADYGEASQVIMDLMMKDPVTFDRLMNVYMGVPSESSPEPTGERSAAANAEKQELAKAEAQRRREAAAPIRPTAPGGKDYEPGYVPYPNPNNYKPVSAGEKAYVRSLQTLPALVNVVSTILGNDEGSAATPADWALQYARGDYTPITKSPGTAYNQHTMELISAALDSPGSTPRGSVNSHTYSDRKGFDYIRDTSIRNSLGQFNYRVTANGIEITDTFNFNGVTNIGALEVVDNIIGTATGGVVDEPLQRNADKLVDIGYRMALEKGQNPADDKHGIPIKYTIPWSEVPAKLQNKLDPTQTISPIVKRKRGTKTESTTFNKLKKHRQTV